jgi:hypothetical protein
MIRTFIVLLAIVLAASCTNQDQAINMKSLKTLFGKKEAKRTFTEDEYEKHYDLKMIGLENVLGKSSNIVGHAIIPFEVGGAVDMYYFPQGAAGTGFATMELIAPDGSGPIPTKLGTYELVAFTKTPYTEDTVETNPFNLIERHICGIFTGTGNYSFQAKLEPLQTAELPQNEGEPTLCLIFDQYRPDGKEFKIGNKKHGLLLIMEVHRQEMEFARTYGTRLLIDKLKEKGYYPYSDLNRESVIQ